MTQIDRVRSVLLGAPSTAYEVGVCTGLGMRLASAHLTNLLLSGQAAVVGEIQTETRGAQLYALTVRGRAKASHLREWDEIDAEQQKGQAA